MLRMMKNAWTKSQGAYRRTAGQRGFTLLETLVVVAIIGMIVVIAIPNLRRSMVRADLLDEVNMLRGAVGVARINAVKSGQRVAMVFLDGTGPPPGGVVMAWVDSTPDEIADDVNELILGRWFLGDNTVVSEDDTQKLYPLPGTLKGVVCLPTGAMIASETGDIGVGRGAVIISDRYNNRIRLTIQAGAGSVIEEMWDPETSTWSNEIRFWRY